MHRHWFRRHSPTFRPAVRSFVPRGGTVRGQQKLNGGDGDGDEVEEQNSRTGDGRTEQVQICRHDRNMGDSP
jgi:hypothetical protein